VPPKGTGSGGEQALWIKMPQLSIETYVTQYYWLIVILGFFYYYISTQIVPKIGEIKKTRAKIAAETPIAGEKGVNGAQNLQIGIFYNLNKVGENKRTSDLLENMNKNWANGSNN